MICTKCGYALPDDSAFCQYCGAELIKQKPKDAEVGLEDKENEESYETIFSASPYVIQDETPVIIESVLLRRNKNSGALSAVCRFSNIGQNTIIAAQVDIRCKNIWGEDLSRISGFQYVDMNICHGEAFGEQAAIPIPDSATRSASVVLRKLAFSDLSVAVCPEQGSKLPYDSDLRGFIKEPELYSEYVRETTPKSTVVPVEGKQYWRCACGEINSNKNSSCLRCKVSKEKVFSLLDPSLLRTRLDAYKTAQMQKAYDEAAYVMANASRKTDYDKAASMFAAISGFKDAEAKAAEARQLGKEAEEKDCILFSAANAMKENTLYGYQRAISLLEQIPGWKTADSDLLKAQKLLKLLEAIKAEAARREKNAVLIFLILGFITIALAAFFLIIPSIKYSAAEKALAAHDYDSAFEQFSSLGSYNDSSERAREALYNKGSDLMAKGDYSAAAASFEMIPWYKDCSKKAQECRNEASYIEADELFNSAKYVEAAEIFSSLVGYKDSEKRACEAGYINGNNLIEANNYAGAYEVFKTLGTYNDSSELAEQIGYLYAKELFDAGEYGAAYLIYTELGEYKYSAALANKSEYLYASELFDAGKYQEAFAAYELVADYKDAQSRAQEAKYQYALLLMETSDWEKAAPIFLELGGYKDSDKQYKEAQYQIGLAYLSKKIYFNSVTIFKDLGSYSDSQAKMHEAMYGYVVAHYNRIDTRTYDYLIELCDARYEDSKELYAELYSWKVSIIINDSETDDTNRALGISRDQIVYCHLKLSGGPPGGSVKLKYSFTWPDGKCGENTFDCDCNDGETGRFWSSREDPENVRAGTGTARVYDASTGELLGEAKVNITI